MFLTANTQAILNVSQSIDEEGLLLAWHSPLNHHQINALQDGLKCDSHLLKRGIDLFEAVFNALIEKGIHYAA
jgi:hypothetical protein